MEEVDQIIIHSLKSIQVEFEDNVRSISQLPSETIYSACVKCLGVILPEKQFKEVLPKAMSARVASCADVAQTIKDLGFRGDLGYHQLLYPNENDTRTLLNWLTSKLPRNEDDEKKEQTGEFLQTAIENKIKNLLKETWTPSFAIYSKNRRNYSKINNFFTNTIDTPFISLTQVQSRAEAERLLDEIRNTQEFVTKQPKRRIDVSPSILEINTITKTEEDEIKEEWETKGLESGLKPWQFRDNKRSKIVKQMGEHIRYSLEESEALFAKSIEQKAEQQAKRERKANRFTNLVDFSQEESAPAAPQESEEDVKKRRDEEIAILEKQINALKTRLELVSKDLESFQTSIRQNEASIISEDQKRISLEERYRIDCKIFEELLPDAANNIRILQEISQSSSMKLMELATEWEKHRTQLVERYRQLKESNINRKGGSADLLAQIKRMREQMKELEAEINKKDEKYQELLDIYNQLPKNINRSVYTNRILESVKQIKKQKVEINKILLDNRNLQKEINTNIETLGRTFAITNEVIYLDAKSSNVDPKKNKGKKVQEDPTAKTAYRQLVSIHDKFKELSDKVTETGNLINSISDLEEKMQQLMIRAGSLDIDRISEDLKQIQEENKTLQKRLGNF